MMGLHGSGQGAPRGCVSLVSRVTERTQGTLKLPQNISSGTKKIHSREELRSFQARHVPPTGARARPRLLVMTSAAIWVPVPRATLGSVKCPALAVLKFSIAFKQGYTLSSRTGQARAAGSDLDAAASSCSS